MFPYVPPTYNRSAFNCPYCQAYAEQFWSECRSDGETLTALASSRCSHCAKYALWLSEKILYPDSTGAPQPNKDLPEELLADYEEASSILNKSPRGATALLRLCIQKLCKHLGESGKDINKDIGNLVKKGLPDKIQKALDIVRVVGNEAVHPGQLDLKDDINTATKLFALINLTVEFMITQPKEVNDLFHSLPQDKIDGIKNRDKAPNGTN